MKKCRACKKIKDESEFHKCKRNPDGLQHHCKQCSYDRQDKRNKEFKEQGLMNYSQRTRQRLRFEVLQHYSKNDPPSCECCGENHIEFLSIDHINGGGQQARKTILKGSGGLYSWLKRNNFPDGYRVLCHNCNQSLGAYGYCPHKKPNARLLIPLKIIFERKLSDQQLIEIRASTEVQSKLAKKYNVCQQTISRVKLSERKICG